MSFAPDTDLIVDTEEAVASLVDKLIYWPSSPPALYVDLEGVNLGREGSLSILQFYIAPIKKSFLVDIHVLQATAFTTPGTFIPKTLADVLQDPTIPKVFFDIRNDSDALFSLYGIRVAGIIDVQLMELACRPFSKRLVWGLARCIENDAAMSPFEEQKWWECKAKGKDLFCPERGGSYEVFNQRPMSKEIVDYCVQDVEILPRLHATYAARLKERHWVWIKQATENRITDSQSATYQGQGRHKALAPAGWNKLY